MSTTTFDTTTLKGVLQYTTEVTYAGPATGITATAPLRLSPFRPRRVQGVSESDDEPVFVGDTEIINQDYRCGGPILVPLPAQSQGLTNDVPLHARWVQGVRSKVLEILQNFDIDPEVATAVKRYTKTTQNIKSHLTVFIIAKKDESKDSWYSAAKEIRQLLCEEGLDEVNVELFDRRAHVPVTTLHIPPSHPFVSQWPVIRPLVLQALGYRDWTNVAVLRRKHGSNAPVVTITITVEEKTKYEWVSVRERIIGILDAYQQTDVAVEIRRGRIFHTDSRPLISRENLATIPTPGSSLGVSGNTASSSTFGGFLELYLDGQWKMFGVTNYHCVVPGTSPNPMWDEHGVNPQGSSIEVDLPSTADILSLKEFAQSQVNEHEATLAQFSRDEMEMIQADNIAVPRSVKRRYEVAQKVLEGRKKDVLLAEETLNKNKQKLGKVFAASGFRENENETILDWAMIEILPSRSGGANRILDKADVPEQYRYEYDPNLTIIMDTEQPYPDLKVFKMGRRTGFTGGRVNGVKETDLKSWVRTPDGAWRKKTSKALVVVSERENEPFGDSGDSGSFIINGSGMLLGLYLGGDDQLGTGLFTSVEDLFADIKFVTGALDIRLPNVYPAHSD